MINTDARYFPIRTRTSCQLKWNWSTIRLYDGTTSSCHRVDPDYVGIDSLESFHNTPKKISDRNLMLQGLWPSGGCEYCKRIEDAGGISDRMFHLQIPNMSPPELDHRHQDTVTVTPRIVEVYFDNVCNMSCLYCWDGFSSKIYQENKKFGRFEQEGVVIDNTARRVPNLELLTEKFWEWMAQNHANVFRFHVLGGEPFFQPQFDQCMDFFDQHISPNLELNVISNLKVSDQRLENILSRIKSLVDHGKIKRFDLTASIDCFGPEQEYVRFGLDLSQWKKNFEILTRHDFLTLNINQTLSALTVKSVPELLRFVNQFRHDRDIGHYFSTTVMTHEFLHPGIFGTSFFSDDFDQILNVMPDRTWSQRQSLDRMQGIKLQIENCQRDQIKINQLGIFLEEIDRRRGLDWRHVFPWLEKEIGNVV